MRKNRRRTRGMILVCFLALLGLGTTAAWFFLPPLTLRVAIGPMGSDNQKLLAAFVRGWEDAHPRVRMKLVSTTDAVTSTFNRSAAATKRSGSGLACET